MPAAANSQGDKTDRQNQDQHDQVEILFLHEAALDDWKQGHNHGQKKAVHYTGSRKNHSSAVEVSGFYCICWYLAIHFGALYTI